MRESQAAAGIEPHSIYDQYGGQIVGGVIVGTVLLTAGLAAAKFFGTGAI